MPRRVTLTFDNGPTSGISDRVLDILGGAGIRAAFFLIGRKLADPSAMALARAAHAAGHWIGNHTLTHSVAFGDRLDAAYAASEIGDAQALIGDLSHPERLFRPYGNSGLIGPHLFSEASIAYLLAHRYRTILWNCVPGDWRDPDGWVETCIAQARQLDWSVIVLHDTDNGCLARLPELLRRLDELGVTYEQDFPDAVTLTRGGRVVSLSPGYVRPAMDAGR